MRNFFVFITFLFSASCASAHVKWFAQESIYVRPYQITDIPVLLSIIIGILLIIIGIYADRRFHVPGWVMRMLEKSASSILSLASIGFGVSFVLFSYFGFIFAPNLIPVGENATLLITLQAIAGAMILFGLYERLGGFVLVALFCLGIYEFGFMEMMDTTEMLGFALYAMIIGRPKWKITESDIICRLTHRIHQYGVSLLRVGTGINLIILGLSEKILAPSLTQDFLMRYQWNFMAEMGMTHMSNYWFAYAAGVGEVMFGIFLLCGFMTRTTIIGLALFLITTLVLLGPMELIGHLPHFSIALVLIIFGAGSRLHQKR